MSPPSRTLTIHREQLPSVAVITLSGMIDETLPGDAFAGIATPLVINVDGITRVTSYGVRQWTRAIKACVAPYIGVTNAHACMVVQYNSVSGFAGSSELLSIFSPFICPKCQHEFEELTDLREAWGLAKQAVEPRGTCPRCESPGEFDDIPSSYFSFAAEAHQPNPPPAVLGYLTGRSEVELKPVESLRISKHVEGNVTALWLSGPLNGTARFKRVADGLEGEVLFVGSEISWLDDAGVSLFRAFLDTCVFDVWLARFDERVLKAVFEREEPARHIHVVDASTPADSAVVRYLAAHAKAPGTGPSDSAEGPVEGNRIGKYRLRGRLGAGGMAEVFLAHLEGPGGFEKKVVLKRILKHLSNDSEFVEMFLQEARLAARISHPNVVQIFEIGNDRGEYFIAMEYVRGVDLHVLIKTAMRAKQMIPVPVALGVVSELCAGLQAAHGSTDDQGRPVPIIHRDVSPQNVLVSMHGEIKVTDFGIAKAEDSNMNTPTTTLKGKVAYMAPEQAVVAENVVVDHRADIFSAGILLYNMLTLVQPFRRETEALTRYALLHKNLDPVRSFRTDVSFEIERIVSTALARDPNDRYQNARALQDDLKHQIVLPAGTTLQDTIAAWARATLEMSEELIGYSARALLTPTTVIEEKTPVTMREQNRKPTSTSTKDTV